MQLSKKKTAELTGTALDWAVAKALGYDVFINPFNDVMRKISEPIGCYRFEPSTNWSHGGPLIDENNIWLSDDGLCVASCEPHTRRYIAEGDTNLIAICRAVVAARLGEEVEIPTDLIGA
ncbi:DUF2591 domain-containing protein [Cronobacter turicensis]|uniref:DUF2591 domain-containing protein n=2 Tax=Cronobacter turicensis TaxID=413502 RepID=A0A2T7B4T6_9ENTR|nr:phage protein NinX family protein [Cronobacter turicensis]PUX22028.1 DUF2591 domain-containing protein [Cronobacter turicensis]PUX32350.1 DUF2591 domain-containing protein [Cronobacter turicensis]